MDESICNYISSLSSTTISLWMKLSKKWEGQESGGENLIARRGEKDLKDRGTRKKKENGEEY